MPTFELVPIEEAMRKTATLGKRGELLMGYMKYVDELEEGQAGRLQATPGETVGAVRRRLGAAAKLAGKDIVIKRTKDEVYFWVEQRKTGRRRGRPRKMAEAESQ